MENCLFCKIAEKKLKAKIRYENEKILAFEDINPQAPVHLLIIPKEHIETINDLNETSKYITSEMIITAVNIAKEAGIESYRLVINCNEDAGQSVFHIHLHLLGGRKMNWPPG